MSVNGQKLVAFNFDYNNVLAWREEAGYSAWLQFLVLPGGPVFVGKISNSGYDGGPLSLYGLPGLLHAIVAFFLSPELVACRAVLAGTVLIA